MNAIGREKLKQNYSTMELFYSLGTYKRLRHVKDETDLKEYIRWVAYRIGEESPNQNFRAELEHLVSLCIAHVGVHLLSRLEIRKQFVSVWDRAAFQYGR